MKNLIQLLIFITITTFVLPAQSAIWTYGTGEAVNLENQIGFEKAQDIKLFTDGIILGTSFDGGVTTQTLDRQVEVGELIPNNGFERTDLSAVSCTNATITRVADVAGGEFNDHALQVTATGTPWSCDIDGEGGQGTGFAALQSIATVGADAEFCILANGVEQACHQSNILTSKSETFSIPTVLDGTSNSIRIKGTSASNVVTADKASIKAGQLTTTGYYREAIIDLTGSGNFTGGSIRVVSDGVQVVIEAVDELTHASTNVATSGANVLPLWSCPVNAKVNISHIDLTGTSVLRMVAVNGSTSGTPCAFLTRYLSESLGSVNKTTAGNAISIAYATPEAQTVQSFNSMVHKSDLLVSEAGAQVITTENIVTFGTVELISNGTFASNIFTVEQSGHYELEFGTYIGRSNADSAAFSTEAFFRVNGVNLTTPCFRALRYDDTSLVTASDSTNKSSINCFSKRYLTKGDQVSVRMSSGESVSVSRKAFSITPYMNPNGEPVSAVIKNEFVSGGVEQVVAGETWDGEQVYRRCYTVTSDITGTTTIDTLPTGLRPLGAFNYTANQWIIDSVTSAGISTGFSFVRYASDTGILQGTVDTFKIGSGYRFCMRYLK